MSSLIVLCPSFGRPIAASAVLASFKKNTVLPTTRLVFLCWEKDKDSDLYEGDVILCPEKDMVARVNGALGLLEDYSYVGWIADDNRFDTPAWDREVMDALGSHPIVFCNDVVSPGSKPSHVFMDSRIPKSLGWFLLPGLHSTFFDDVWANFGVGPVDVSHSLWRRVNGQKDTGPGLGIAYLHDVHVTHLYIEKDNSKTFATDHDRYRQWLRHDAENDILNAKRALRAVKVG